MENQISVWSVLDGMELLVTTRVEVNPSVRSPDRSSYFIHRVRGDFLCWLAIAGGTYPTYCSTMPYRGLYYLERTHRATEGRRTLVGASRGVTGGSGTRGEIRFVVAPPGKRAVGS